MKSNKPPPQSPSRTFVTTIAQFQYAYDGNRNIEARTYPSGYQSFTYDSYDRLTTATLPNGTYTYTYDSRSNRLTTRFVNTALTQDETTTYAYSIDDRMIGYSVFDNILQTTIRYAEYTYDNAGNTTQKVITENGIPATTSYTYYDDNRIHTVTLPSSEVITFTYFADGSRATKESSTEWITYHYATGLVKEVHHLASNHNTTTFTLHYEPGRIIYEPYGGTPTTYYTVTDTQGTIYKLLDTTGTTVANYTYDPFGNRLTNSAPTIYNPIGFAGTYYDQETNLLYASSRYLDPTTSRFTTKDSYRGDLQSHISQNRYIYCHQNPISYSDPSGFAPIEGDNSNSTTTSTTRTKTEHKENIAPPKPPENRPCDPGNGSGASKPSIPELEKVIKAAMETAKNTGKATTIGNLSADDFDPAYTAGQNNPKYQGAFVNSEGFIYGVFQTSDGKVIVAPLRQFSPAFTIMRSQMQANKTWNQDKYYAQAYGFNQAAKKSDVSSALLMGRTSMQAAMDTFNHWNTFEDEWNNIAAGAYPDEKTRIEKGMYHATRADAIMNVIMKTDPKTVEDARIVAQKERYSRNASGGAEKLLWNYDASDVIFSAAFWVSVKNCAYGTDFGLDKGDSSLVNQTKWLVQDLKIAWDKCPGGLYDPCYWGYFVDVVGYTPGGFVGKNYPKSPWWLTVIFAYWPYDSADASFNIWGTKERFLETFAKETGFNFALQNDQNPNSLFAKMGIGAMFAPYTLTGWEHQPIGKDRWLEAHYGFGLRWYPKESEIISKKWYRLNDARTGP